MGKLRSRIAHMFTLSGANVSKERRRGYILAISFFILLHVFGVLVSLWASGTHGAWNSNEQWFAFFTYLSGLGVLSGLFILLFTLHNEVLLSQAYAFAQQTIRAATHRFP